MPWAGAEVAAVDAREIDRDRHQQRARALEVDLARVPASATRRGCSHVSTSAIAMNTGTIALNAEAGSTSSSTAPVMPPASDIAPKRSTRARWPASSRR